MFLSSFFFSQITMFGANSRTLRPEKRLMKQLLKFRLAAWPHVMHGCCFAFCCPALSRRVAADSMCCGYTPSITKRRTRTRWRFPVCLGRDPFSSRLLVHFNLPKSPLQHFVVAKLHSIVRLHLLIIPCGVWCCCFRSLSCKHNDTIFSARRQDTPTGSEENIHPAQLRQNSLEALRD